MAEERLDSRYGHGYERGGAGCRVASGLLGGKWVAQRQPWAWTWWRGLEGGTRVAWGQPSVWTWWCGVPGGKWAAQQVASGW